MRKIVILKAGSTLPSLRAKKGDFEDWVLAGLACPACETVVVDVRRRAAFPEYEEIAGIVITGSHAMVTQRRRWSEWTAAWLPGAVERGIPVLGICYGHQLLAQALGGKVGDNPNGREFGTVAVHLAAAARRDPLLGRFATPIRVHASHTQSVLRLPPRARRLASSARDPNQAFVVGDCAWGVQFHPEFDAEIARGYIRYCRRELRAEGQDVKTLANACADTPYGRDILARFAAIATRRRH